MIEKDTIYCKLRKPIMMDNASEDNWGAIFLPLEKDVSDTMTHPDWASYTFGFETLNLII